MNKKIIFAIIAIIVLAIFAYGIYYVNDYYHADDDVTDYLNGSGNIDVIKTSNGLLIDGPGNGTAIIFYPGAKVEYTSYLPLLTQIANKDIDCFLVEMPFNLAILGKNSADDIMDEYDYTKYYMAGHSLGGSMASKYINETNKSDGLILLESYPTDSIDKPILSIYGSEDKVLNMEKYNESKSLMDNLTEIVIKGANHAQVGNYGVQQGDGNATISCEKQQSEITNGIVDFIGKCQ